MEPRRAVHVGHSTGILRFGPPDFDRQRLHNVSFTLEKGQPPGGKARQTRIFHTESGYLQNGNVFPIRSASDKRPSPQQNGKWPEIPIPDVSGMIQIGTSGRAQPLPAPAQGARKAD
jgi:hypothetical protein